MSRAADAQRGNTRSVRAVALGITGAVHLVAAAVAAVAFSWQGASAERRGAVPALVTLPMRPQDKRDHLPDPGTSAPSPAAPAAAMVARRSPAAALVPSLQPSSPAPSSMETGGRSDDLSEITLSYRRAIMARLEAQRRYPEGALRSGRQGAGAVLFRIERSGRLLDASVAASTGLAALDSAAIDIVRRAAPFPAIPDGLPDELAITLPVDFLIHASGTASGTGPP